MNENFNQIRLNVLATECVILMLANSKDNSISHSQLRSEVELSAGMMGAGNDHIDEALKVALDCDQTNSDSN